MVFNDARFALFGHDKRTNMFEMFGSFTSLTVLDVGSGTQANVINMSWMFEICSPYVTSVRCWFDTSNVMYMHGLFSHSKATILGVSHFDTSSVVDGCKMF